MLAFAFAANAQFDQGQITGTVKDSSQAVVSGAAVTAKSAATGQSSSTKTDQTGTYLFTNLPVGAYEISVQATGFKTFVRTNVTVNAATRTTVDAALEIGSTTESITVSADVALTTLDTAQIGRTIEANQITDLALNGRNPFNMATLKAGVIGDQFNGFNPGWVEQSVSINGGRKNGNQVTMDGVNLSRARGDATRNTNIGVLNVDSVQEVQILTTTYPAEYGRAMDGQLRFVTKSGTRDFHGTAWEFMRNSVLDANSWTRNNSPKASENSRQAPFRFNQPGYSIGGPVFIPGKFNADRTKLFFFVSQEWVWYRKEQTNTATVPTALMRKGDFSELLSAANPFFSKVRVVKNPYNSGAPFPNNVIDTSLLSHNGMAFLNAYPLPTPGYQAGTANWIKTLPNPITNRKDTLRFDYYLGASRISFSGNHYGYREDQPFSGTFGTGLDTNNTRWNRPNKVGAFAITTTLSPTKINDVTVSGAADRVTLDPYVNTEGHDWIRPRSQYGIDYPYMIPDPAGGKTIADRIPNSVSISGLSGWGGGSRPQSSSGPIYSVADNFTYIAKAEHTLKFGVWVEKATQKNNELPGNQNGNFSFGDTNAPLTTSLAMANAAMGNFDSYSEAGRRPYTLATSYAVEAYGQDTWKPSPKLTVEMGVRWSFRTPWAAKYNDFSGFDPRYYDPKNMAIVDRQTGYIVAGDPYNGIVMPGNGIPDSAKGRANAIYLPNYQRLFHDLPRGFSTPVYKAFAPRLGIAYRLSSKTAVRLGGGMFHHRQMAYGVFGGPPNQETLSVSYGKADIPGGSGGRYTPFSVTSHDGNERYPTAISYSLSIQHELPSGVVVDVAYVGKSSFHLIRSTNINSMLAGTLQANPGVQPNALRFWYGLSTLNWQSSTGRSNYNSFQVSVDRRFHSGLGFGVSYTFSKGLDNITGTANTVYNAWVKAPFEWDVKHLLNLNAIYELPLLRNRKDLVGNLFGGWQISSVAFIRTGFPLSVTDSNDMAGVGSGNQVWNVAGNLDVTGARGIGLPWFNAAAFAQPKAGTFGNAGYGIIRAPGFKNLDATLFKRFRVREWLSSEFRFEAFNCLNHPNLGNPGTNPRTGDFGKITNKAIVSSQANVSTNERNVQLALKFIF